MQPCGLKKLLLAAVAFNAAKGKSKQSRLEQMPSRRKHQEGPEGREGRREARTRGNSRCQAEWITSTPGRQNRYKLTTKVAPRL